MFFPILADMVMDILKLAIDVLGYESMLLDKNWKIRLLSLTTSEQEIECAIQNKENSHIVYLDMKLMRQINGFILTDSYLKPTNKGWIL